MIRNLLLVSERITIHGIGPAIKKLNSLGDPGIMKRGMNRAVQHLVRRIKKYPAQQTSYRRTGTLGRGWTTDVDQGGKRGIVGNQSRGKKGKKGYAIYVQGPRQRHFHKAHGWLTIKDVGESEADTVVGYFEDEYRKAIRK